ncbi:MAG: hypothetical protein PHW66_04820 [Gallionella sp.]|nr:hypothetical protein [Gallionella sp.]
MIVTETKDRVLRQSLIASELRAHEQEVLHRLLSVEYFKAGEKISDSGRLSRDALLILAEGQIRVSALVDEEYFSFTLEECGDIARIATFVGTSVTCVEARIEALTETTLLTLERHQVEALLYRQPQMVYYIMRGLTRYAHRMARRYTEKGDEIFRHLASVI